MVYSDIAAPSITESFDAGGVSPDILATTGTPSPTSSASTISSSPTSSVPSTTPTATTVRHGLLPGQVVAIAVPIVAVVLLVPLVFLLFRSHQYKRAILKRESQRPSHEAILQLQSSTPPYQGQTTRMAAYHQFSSTANKSPQPRPTNSLGLFDFEISPPRTPRTTSISSPTSPRSPARLSVAHLMPVQRSQVSQVSVANGNRPSMIRPNNNKRQSEPSMFLDPPLTSPGPPSPVHPVFAPLDQIGIARSTQSKHTSRNLSNGSSGTQIGHFTGHLPPSDAYKSFDDRMPSPGVPPPIPNGQIYWSDTVTLSGNLRSGGQTPVPALMRTERQSQSSHELTRNIENPPLANYTNGRHSDVSSLSDSGDENYYRRAARESDLISLFQENGGVQPHRII